MKPAFIIGIAGGSGSGKTTVVDALLAGQYSECIGYLPYDAYYHEFGQLPFTNDGNHNWDHPDALDSSLYVDHLSLLRSGLSVERPVYDFAKQRRAAQTVTVHPRPVILLEGILILAVPKLRDQIDLRVYIETPADLRIIRRTVRDINERGRTAKSVADQYQSTVRPMHAQYVEPSKFSAHVWIPWAEDNPVAIELLTARIAVALQGNKQASGGPAAPGTLGLPK